ncbi:TPA: helix-turn-helix transcriptional regulator [Candidatus Scatenecus faecavium]|uniref:Helix-turn-helix transcriptional regulator n=1 Tax=Candidatus Scatenecus faecavium TaxID=2840915 RepID=A0A9D1FX14_9BACT|nr:helix-turn-helix transcriptional regulator [Candidatus Scatenecus faecavium]
MNSKKTDCGAINPDLVEKVKPNMPKINLLFELSDFFKVMSDSTRLRLLWALEEEELCVGDLAVILEMTKSAVSHQLKVLRTAKLVKSRKIGKNVYYSLDDHHVKTVLEKALEHVCE